MPIFFAKAERKVFGKNRLKTTMGFVDHHIVGVWLLDKEPGKEECPSDWSARLCAHRLRRYISPANHNEYIKLRAPTSPPALQPNEFIAYLAG